MARVADERSPLSADHVLATLATLPAVAPLEMLAAALELGCDSEALADTLAALEDSGAVSTWVAPDDAIAVILTPHAAARLGVRLDGRSEYWVPARIQPFDDERPRWTTEADCTGPNGDGLLLNGFADHDAMGGLDSLIAAEDAGRAADVLEPVEAEADPGEVAPIWRDGRVDASAKVPKPTLLLGLSLAWSPALMDERPCPGCGGRPLPPIAACLVCHAFGLGHLLQPVAAHELPKPSTNGKPSDPEEPVESRRRGYVVKGNVEVPEKYSRLLKGKANARQRGALAAWEPESGGYRMNQNRRK